MNVVVGVIVTALIYLLGTALRLPVWERVAGALIAGVAAIVLI